MRLSRRIALALALSAAAPGVAGAQMVYDNGTPGGFDAFEMTAERLAAEFVLSSAGSFDLIRFWAASPPGRDAYLGSITWQLFADAANGPGSVLFEGSGAAERTLEPDDFVGYDRYRYDLFTGAVSLEAGRYWLSLHNGPLSVNTVAHMYWETSANTGTTYYDPGFYDDTPFNDSWIGPDPYAMSFQLHQQSSVAPEPVSMALLGTGLAGVAALRRRRRREAESV